VPRPSFPTTVQEFTALFSTQEAGEGYRERCRAPDGFGCVRCGSLHGWRIVRAVRSRARSAPPGTPLRRVVWECADCHEQVSLTSGTILARHLGLGS